MDIADTLPFLLVRTIDTLAEFYMAACHLPRSAVSGQCEMPADRQSDQSERNRPLHMAH